MRIVIDRLEQDHAVCELEDGSMTRIPRILLPEGCKDGSVLDEENGLYTLLSSETETRKKRISGKLAALLRKR